jgi:peptidoglycan hydrolase-like protein with peptidoglycan-binding domain
VRRPSALGWLLGSTEKKTLVLRAPTARPEARWLSVPHGQSARVKFDQPVHAVAFGSPGNLQRKSFRTPTRSVAIGAGASAGEAVVASAPRSWETLGRPARVTWFPATAAPTVVSSPAPGSDVTPSSPLRLTFSKPVSQVLGSARPSLSPQTPGSWHQTNAHTLVFQPSGYGAPMGTTLHATLPKQLAVVSAGGSVSNTSEVTWTVPDGSPLRLQQLLAEDGYMPVTWKPSGKQVANTPAAQVRAAVQPPAGSFTWRFPNTPAPLQALWAHRDPAITKGALMAFEDAHGLTMDGVAGPAVWRALIADAVAGKTNQSPDYNYVYVSMNLPEKLTLWHDGKTIFTTPANTGIAQAPTATGTYPVYLRESVGTMSGTNPDGSHYNDPGIRYISYFNGGDAVHAFNRASFGTPQSLGCVELPLASAAKVYPYMGYGTLVTVL